MYTQTQQDFIDTIDHNYPFLVEDDKLTDALDYALSVSEQDDNGNFRSSINGHLFTMTNRSSEWDGNPLTQLEIVVS